MKNPAKSDVGNIAAIVILFNLAFLGNNPFVLLGVSIFVVVMAIHYIRIDKEKLKFNSFRIGLSVLLILLSVGTGIYLLTANSPAPISL